MKSNDILDLNEKGEVVEVETSKKVEGIKAFNPVLPVLFLSEESPFSAMKRWYDFRQSKDTK